MRRSTTVLSILALGLALGIPGASAVALTTGAVDAYQGAYADNAVTGGADSIAVGNPRREREAVIARLDERRVRHSNATIEDEPDGGSGVGGSAGGVGSR